MAAKATKAPGAGTAFAVLAFRYVTGQHLDGRTRSDATFLHDGMEAEPTHWSRNPWWPRMAGWKRAAIRLAPLAVAWGWWQDGAAVSRASAVAAGAVLGWGLVVAIRWREDWAHYRSRVRPLHYALAGVLEAPRKPQDWLQIPADFAVNKDAEIVIRAPRDFTASDRDKDDIRRAIEAKLPELEAPDFDWDGLAGHKPRIIVKHSDPPPGKYRWDRIAADVAAAAPDELITGIGKHGKIVKVSVETDSPHFGISMGTGGGKSNLASFWLLQELRRGSIVLILDAKHFSHPWAFKDMDAEYGLLPNVGYARWIPDLHDAMVWLGQELSRRTLEAERIINAKGDLLGDVGPRLWIVAEEMNLATPLLKQHWADIRDKEQVKKSPALTGLGAVAFAGRAVKMHLIVIGQQLTAETLGGGSVRENIGVRCLARYTQNTWKMQAGDVPMPPSPSVPGRVQCITADGVSEAQVPLMDLEQVRELALAGKVTECPPEMPGTRRAAELAVPAPGSIDMSPDQPGVLGLTLARAVTEGFFVSIGAARKARQRQGWEPVGGDQYSGYEYALADLRAYVQPKGKQ